MNRNANRIAFGFTIFYASTAPFLISLFHRPSQQIYWYFSLFLYYGFALPYFLYLGYQIREKPTQYKANRDFLDLIREERITRLELIDYTGWATSFILVVYILCLLIGGYVIGTILFLLVGLIFLSYLLAKPIQRLCLWASKYNFTKSNWLGPFLPILILILLSVVIGHQQSEFYSLFNLDTSIVPFMVGEAMAAMQIGVLYGFWNFVEKDK
jgi:hypothetical protein